MGGLQDLVALIRADTPLIVIETTDEARAVDLVRQSLLQVWRAMWRWSITEGLRRIDIDGESGASPVEASSVLREIHAAEQRGVYLLLDFDPYLDYAGTQRQLRDLIERRNCKPHVLVMIGAKVELPTEIEPFAVRFRPRLPDLNTLLKLVREQVDAYAQEHGGKRAQTTDESIQRIARNLQGLHAGEARRIARQLIFADGVLDDSDLAQLARLKYELLNRSGHLHYEYDTARFTDVIGATRAKRWVEQRRQVLTDGNPPPGLDPPKGILLLGVQGCGKSLLAKAVAGSFGVPLLRLEFGALYNKYHGETERNLREALASAEQLAPCVLWIDEIEKGLASSGGSEDAGVSRRLLGYFLTWLAERKSNVFIVATANQVHELPPELLRKGRFDEIFFVDLPAASVRQEIFDAHLRKRGIGTAGFDMQELALASEGFSGAEIEQAVVSAMYAAHAAACPLSQGQLRDELRQTRPLAVLMREQVEALRDWARERTVPAD
jgi:hypothetical protein